MIDLQEVYQARTKEVFELKERIAELERQSVRHIDRIISLEESLRSASKGIDAESALRKHAEQRAEASERKLVEMERLRQEQAADHLFRVDAEKSRDALAAILEEVERERDELKREQEAVIELLNAAERRLAFYDTPCKCRRVDDELELL